MARPVRILHLEDNTADADLVQAMLAEDGLACEIVCVETSEDFKAALDRGGFDLILSDFSLPQFNGITALAIARKKRLAVPFIFVSGTMGEETAVATLQAGATDYVVKQRLARLPAVIRRALKEAEEQAELKRAEEALRRIGRQNELLLNSAGEGIYGLDLQGCTTFINPAAARMIGGEAEDLIGKPQHNIVHHSKPDGTPYPQNECQIHAAFKDSTIHQGDDEVFWRKDGTSFPVEYISTPIRDERGGIVGAVVTFRDITERKRLEEQFRQAQKMEAVGQLTGGIAHDFNNLLTVINGYSELTLRNLKADDPLRPNLEQIKEAGERAAGLTRQLLAFSRKQVLAPKVLDLNAVVTNLDKMLQRLIGEDIELVTVLKPGLGRVKADPGQIEQVILNLIVNARDAMAQGGKLTIETADVELDENFARRHVVVKPGRYVMLAVSDTGCGMDAKTQKRIFEPFFTTKRPGKGTGLGLATVYGIVKQSGGSIWVYSEVGQGTTFKVYLPRVEEEPDAVLPSTVRAAPLKGAETILLVEDDEPLRKLTLSILRHGGYHVLAASSREEAIQLCGQHQGPIHLMLTDVVMPGMSVGEFAEQLASTRPAMKVLHMSGYTDDTVVRHGVLEQSVAFLQKPFTTHSLLRKVREVLDVDSNKDSRSI